MTDLDTDTKTLLLGVFLAVLDGRDPRHHLNKLDGLECRAGHTVIRDVDQLLKARWLMLGAPEQETETKNW